MGMVLAACSDSKSGDGGTGGAAPDGGPRDAASDGGSCERAACPAIQPICKDGEVVGVKPGECCPSCIPAPDGGTADTGGKALKYYSTCGDPVCSSWKEKPGVALCTSQKEGAVCAKAGEECDPKNDCNALLRCADADPRQQTGGCPISRREFKKDIRYLDRQDIAKLHESLLGLRLAAWKYREQTDSRERLGFILEDHPDSPASDLEHDRADLYGLMSMAVGALQSQAREIEALRREIRVLREREDAPLCSSAPPAGK